MKKRHYIFALAFAGLTLTACGSTGSVGLKYDDTDLDIDTEWVEYSVPVTKVSFAEGEDSIIVNRGETHEYSYSIEPIKAIKKSLSWSSSDEEVATVSGGVVTGIGVGKCKITCYNEVESFTPIELDVEVVIEVEDIAFKGATLEADFNHEYQLYDEVTFTPDDTTETELSWAVDDESVATIDNKGVLTTKNVAGVVKVTATSAYINKVIELKVDVADRTIYPDGVIVKEYEANVEIGHNSKMVAESVVSSDHEIRPTHPEVYYYSSNPNILSVDEVTGAIRAFEVGTTTVFATAMGKDGVIKSEEKTIKVFEVKVQSIELKDINLTNATTRNGFDLLETEVDEEENVHFKHFSYTTDTPNNPVASVPEWVFEVDNQEIAKVDGEGKITALVNYGNTHLTLTDKRSGVFKEVNLHVGYEANSLTVKGSAEIDAGKTTQLEVTSDPKGVPTELLSFSSSDSSIATVDEKGLVTGIAEGEATITVSFTDDKSNVVSKEHKVKVNIPEIPFASGYSYIVGNNNYYSGVSKPSITGSWDKANQAKVIDHKTQDAHDNLLYERSAVVKFAKGDIWQVRTASSYLPVDGHGDSYDIGTYNTGTSVFVGTSPDMSVYVTEEGYKNVLVNRTGYYIVYHAQYTNEHPEGWFNIYTERYELTVSDTTPQVQVGTTVTIEAHNWQGELKPQVSEGSDLITLTRDDYKFNIKAGDTTGTAKIVFTDDWKSVEVLVTITTDAPLPKTFDDGVPYVVGDADYHTGTAVGKAEYWGTDASKGMKCVVSSEEPAEGVVVQYETTITFLKDNQFKVVIGGDELFWNVAYQDSEGAFAKKQMSHPDNVVVNVEGTYKIYVKCLDNNRGWQVFIEPKQSGPTVPDYYLAGTFTSPEWAIKEEFKLVQDSINPNKFTINDVTLKYGDTIKVNDPELGDFGWYGVDHVYDNCHFVVGSNNDCIIFDKGTYDISFYLDSDDGNHIQLNLHEPQEFDINKETKFTVINQTGKEFTGNMRSVKLHMFDIQFAVNSPITSVAGLESNKVKIGDKTWYNSSNGVIDVQMTWVTDDPCTEFTVTFPAYIESCKMCIYNSDNVWVHEVHFNEKGESWIDGESSVFTVYRGYDYTLYLCNHDNYDAWLSGDHFNTPTSMVASYLPPKQD